MKPIKNNRPKTLLTIVTCIFALLTIAGCQGTKRAYEAAEGVDQNAKVVAEHYYALVREANSLKQSGVLEGGDLVKAQDLVRSTRPAIDQLALAARAYDNANTAETEAELNQAILEASTAISQLIDIIKAARDRTGIQGNQRFSRKTASQIAV